MAHATVSPGRERSTHSPSRPTALPVRFILLTKTSWNEPPRIRHQVTEMLLRRGHDVLFVERNAWLGRVVVRREGPLVVARHGEMIHHQLRVFPWLSRMNAMMEASGLDAIGIGADRETIILNFNYDHYFIRDLAPHNAIVSVLNDDFIAAARWFSRREASRVLEATLRISDHTLVVSRPLHAQARRFTDRASLFLPWARRPYSAPASGASRSEVLYWGYINDRIDLALVTELMSLGVIVNFIGPVSGSRKVAELVAYRNARYHGQGQLNDFSEILDRCACSILPYDMTNSVVVATTISNRAFDLLSAGFPLLYSPLPALLDAPTRVIRVCRTANDYVEGLRESAADFDAVQPLISDFLRAHSEDERYSQLMAVVESARNLHRTFAD